MMKLMMAATVVAYVVLIALVIVAANTITSMEKEDERASLYGGWE